jgi:NAD(P)-dependent dehydrogenase (short-subunit alcohol dehydrogenase family)
MTPSFDGKVAVITGAASGIGRAVAHALHGAGASVLIADLDGDRAAAVAGELGDNARSVACDVSEQAEVDAAVGAAVDGFGGLDVMVNNAGICVISPVHELAEDDFDRMIAVNLKGTFHGIKAAVPYLIPRGGGAIVSIASTAGLSGAPMIGGYGATKAGIVSLTRTASVELRSAGIRINCVCPAMVETPFSDALTAGFEAATGQSANEYFAAKQGRLGQPEDIAKVVVHLASEEAGWVTGIAYAVDGGLTAAYT